MANKKGVLEYETTKENKARRKRIPRKDYRLDNSFANRWEHFTDLGFLKLRQSFTNIIKHFRSTKMVYGVVLFLISIWTSGFYAHAGMKFESLLAVVLGVVILVTIGLMKGVKK
jgi:hypothetical protein